MQKQFSTAIILNCCVHKFIDNPLCPLTSLNIEYSTCVITTNAKGAPVLLLMLQKFGAEKKDPDSKTFDQKDIKTCF